MADLVRRAGGSLFALAIACGVQAPAEGHKPLQIGGMAKGHSLETAQEIKDPEISWVLYLELRWPGQFDAFTFTSHAGAVIPIQLGIPQIPRLKNFRPTAILIGPGLPRPAHPVPVALPPETGAVFLRFDARDPETFHEPFSRTTSWVTPEYRTPLPRAGRYHVLVYDPEGDTGKYFLAIGKREAFTFRDWLSLPATLFRVRRFYEL